MRHDTAGWYGFARTAKALSPAHLRALYAERLEAGYVRGPWDTPTRCSSRSSRQRSSTAWVPRNVAEAVRPPRAHRKEVRPLTRAQVRTLLAEAQGDTYEALYAVAVTAGLKRGELLGLMWKDVDLEVGVLRVSRTLQKGELTPRTTFWVSPLYLRVVSVRYELR